MSPGHGCERPGMFAPDHLCALTWAGFMGGGSPDRADAMVWAMPELFERERGVPRVRGL